MKFSPTRIINLIVIIIVLFLNYSCSKDSDLLADYVVGENAGRPGSSIDLQNGTIITFEDKMVAINILKNSPSSSKPKSTVVKKVEQPKNGKTEIKTDSTIVYTPNKDFTGKDDVVYTVEETTPDNTTVKKENTIVVAVNPVLEVKEDKMTTTADKKVVIPVLKNDTYADKNTATVTNTTTPTKGTVVVNNDNTLTYTPNADATGSDTFTYTAQVENTEKTASTTAEGTVIVDFEDRGKKGDISMGELLAFPGAEGFGKYTTGGRGGKVVFVTNLKDSGSGSLRYAIENNSGPRTVVFRISGYIDLSSYIEITNGHGDLTIAGETAPGDGITLRGYGLHIQTSNIIIRHIRARVGKANSNIKGFRITNSKSGTTIQNIIIDHVSSSWGTDENFAIAGYYGSTVKNLTLQNSILSENMGSGAALLMGSLDNISFYQNYLANNTARMFRSSTSGPRFEVINNIFYNYKGGTQTSYDCDIDVIGNVYKSGSNVKANSQAITYQFSSNTPDADPTSGHPYQTDNIVINNSNGTTNGNWNSNAKNSRVITNSLIAPYSSSLVSARVLSNVGAYPHDAVDIRTIEYFSSGGGSLISSEDQVGGYPSLKSGTPYTDSDNDGMDDNWELANNLDPNDSSDGQKDRNGDGYTNLEEFLYYLKIK